MINCCLLLEERHLNELMCLTLTQFKCKEMEEKEGEPGREMKG